MVFEIEQEAKLLDSVEAMDVAVVASRTRFLSAHLDICASFREPISRSATCHGSTPGNKSNIA